MGDKNSGATDSAQLTPTQRHLLLKVLICAQIHDEFALLDEKGALQQYGPPFVDNAADARRRTIATREAVDDDNDERTTRPLILLHLFHAHLRRFPGLAGAKSQFWRKCIVPVFGRIDEAHFSSSAERGEVTVRKLINVTATRYVATYWARGVGVRGKGEGQGPKLRKDQEDLPWGQSKGWGAGTVKRGLALPLRPSHTAIVEMDAAFGSHSQYSSKDQKIWQTATDNVDRIKSDWLAWKEDIIENKNGLSQTLEALQEPLMDNIAPRYRNAAEWVRRHVAFILWTVLVKFPGGDDIFEMIKTIHGLFPYWAARQLLKIANAQTMIKAMIDLVLARPMWTVDSLGQRIFFIVIHSDIQKIENKMLTPLRKAISDDDACKAIDSYVSKRTKDDRIEVIEVAKRDKCDILVAILKRQGYKNVSDVASWQSDFASSPYAQKLDWAYPEEARKARHVSMPSSRIKLPKAGSKATKFAHLKLYLRERLRRRDREEARKIGSGPLMPDAIRTLLEVVFYKQIHAIAKASNLSSRLADFQAFVDDLINVKSTKQIELEDWIALCARHEKHMYFFMHEIRTAIKPIFDWCQEALDYMALSSSTPWDPEGPEATDVEINLDEMLLDAVEGTRDVGEGKKSREQLLKAILAELGDVETYVCKEKMHLEFALRKEYARIRDDTITNVTLINLKGQGGDAQSAADVSDARNRREKPSEPMSQKLVQTEAHPPLWMLGRKVSKAALQRKQEGPRATRATDSPIVSWGYYMPDDILLRRYIESLADRRELPQPVIGASDDDKEQTLYAPPPQLLAIRRHLLPVFRRYLRTCLPDWVKIAQP